METVLLTSAILLAGADARPADPWAGGPVWVASTAARLYDVSPDGKRFLYADGRKFGVFDRGTGKMVWQIDNSTIHSAKFSPNGRTIVAGEWQNGLNLYDADTGKQLYQFMPVGNNGSERVWQADFRPDGTILFQTNSAYSYTITHWDPVARKEINSFAGEIKPKDSHIWVWQRGAGFFLEKSESHNAGAFTGVITRRTVSYTDPLTGKTTPTIELELNDSVLDLSADGKLLLVRTVGKAPRVIDTATGKKLFTLDGHKRVVTGGAFSRDGKLIATVSGTKLSGYDHATLNVQFPDNMPAEVIVWEVPTAKPEGLAQTAKPISRTEYPTKELDFVEVHFSPDSKFIYALSRDGKEGKERKLVALGQLPFAETGGVELAFPVDEAPKPKLPPVVATPGAIVGDPLDRLIDELAKSTKPAADKIDALFLAALGRFATASEQKRAKDRYGDKLTTEHLRALLAEIAATPEFDAHLKSLQKRAPAKPGTPLPQPGTRPGGLVPGGFPSFEEPRLWHGMQMRMAPSPLGYEQFPNGWSGPWSYFPLPSPAPAKKP